MKTEDKTNAIIKKLMDDGTISKYSQLLYRWDNEKEYEDWKDYIAYAKKVHPNFEKLTATTVTFKFDELHIQAKFTKRQIRFFYW